MPTIYETKKGDSFRTISSKFFGDRSQAVQIQIANPPVKYTQGPPITTSSVLVQGQQLVIPDLVDSIPSETAETKKIISLFSNTPSTIPADDPDEVTITINGQAFKNFNGLGIKFDYDKIANEFNFKAPFDPDIKEYRDAFKSINQPTAIYIGGKLVITGQSFAKPNLSDNANTVNVSGYSITGAINKSAIVAPFEFIEGTSFTDIAADICGRFGIAIVIDPQAADLAAKPFEKRIEFSSTEAAGSKLAELARERGLVISNTFNGRVLITRPNTEAATVQAFVQGELPVLNFSPTYNADALHTGYIGYAPETSDEDKEAGTFPLNGIPQPGIIPRLKGIAPSNTDNQGLEDAVRAERGRAYGNWLSASLLVSGWRDKNGDLWQPNKLVSVKAPRVMVYDDTKFFVRGVLLIKSDNKKQAQLDLILPEALTGRDLKITV